MAGKDFIINYVNRSLAENGLNEQTVIYRITARSMRMERRYYIDNLRWMASLLLFPFHAAPQQIVRLSFFEENTCSSYLQ